MKSFNRILLALLFVSSWSACKQNDLDLATMEDSYRIKKIIETDNWGEEVRWDLFTYDAEKLVLWQHFHKTETDEMAQDWKLEAKYEGNSIVTTKSKLKNNSWTDHQKCTLIINDNHVIGKAISRLDFPQCDNCWRYAYHYKQNNFIGWDKYSKTEDGEWTQIRRVAYVYENNRLVEYYDSVNFDNTNLRLDYKRIYSYENDRIAGWIGGICIENSEWRPTQKVAYTYASNNISTKSCLRWTGDNATWAILASESYYFDENNLLIEETSSLGTRIMYEYEQGKGNAALIYCVPDENEEAEPGLKSSF